MTEPAYDEDALIAGVDLVGRTGATDFEVGYLHDDVPVAEAGWYAKAQYRGARLTAEDHPGPVEAVECPSPAPFERRALQMPPEGHPRR